METVHPISISEVNELKVPEIDFIYSITLDVSLRASKTLVKGILANFGQNTSTVKAISRLTWSDYSESDSWAHYGSYGKE